MDESLSRKTSDPGLALWLEVYIRCRVAIQVLHQQQAFISQFSSLHLLLHSHLLQYPLSWLYWDIYILHFDNIRFPS